MCLCFSGVSVAASTVGGVAFTVRGDSIAAGTLLEMWYPWIEAWFSQLEVTLLEVWLDEVWFHSWR